MSAATPPWPEQNPFFANRVLEIRRSLKEARQFCSQVEAFTHIASSLNPSDLGTRPGISMQELESGPLGQR